MSSPQATQTLAFEVASTNGSTKRGGSRTPVPLRGSSPGPSKPLGVLNMADMSSLHELAAFIETMLEQLDATFDDMSSQIIERMIQISERVDALEASIQDIINDADALASSGSASSITQLPTPATTPTVQLRRTRGGLQ